LYESFVLNSTELNLHVQIGLECHLSLEELTLEVQKSFVSDEVIVSTN